MRYIYNIVALIILILVAPLIHRQVSYAQTALLTEGISDIDWSPDGSQVATSSFSGAIRIWDTTTGETIITLQNEASFQSLAVDWSLDGTKLVAAVGSDIIVWGTGNWQEILTISDLSDPQDAVGWSPDGSAIVSASYPGRPFNFHLWDATTGQQIRQLESYGGYYSIDWSQSETDLILISRDNRVEIYSAGTGERLQEFLGHTAEVSQAKWSPDGNYIASGDINADLFVWNSNTGEVIHTIEGHTDWIYSVSWSPDGSQIASASQDGTVKVWDFATGELISTIQVGEAVYTAAFSPDGTKIAYGSTSSVPEIVDRLE